SSCQCLCARAFPLCMEAIDILPVPKRQAQTCSSSTFGIFESTLGYLILAPIGTGGLISIRDFARAHGMWTYEPRQGRKAATVVCSACAVVTLAFFSLRFALDHLSRHTLGNRPVNRKSQIVNRK